MIKHKVESYHIVLTFSEIAALEDYLRKEGKSLCHQGRHATFEASAHGVEMKFGSEREADEFYGLVIRATQGENDDK